MKVTALVELQENVPLTIVPEAESEKADSTEFWSMSSLNPRLTEVLNGTPVAPSPGEQDVTVGAGGGGGLAAVVNWELNAEVRAFPARSLAEVETLIT